MKELTAGVGIMAICLIGSMQAGRAPVSTYDVPPHDDVAEYRGWDSMHAHGMAMPPERDETAIPVIAPDVNDCRETTARADIVVSSDEEASRVCRTACSFLGGDWTGRWHTSIGGNNTFCGCRICTAAQ